jgi:uncharacterized membrane protein (DUF2068 family)
MSQRSHDNKWIVAIGALKVVKGILLIAAGIGVLKLVHKDIGQIVEHWIEILRVDSDNRLVHSLLARAFSLDDRRLKEIGVGTFAYAGLFLTEGSGLLLRKRWAELFTIIVTGSFLPLEIFELVRHVSIAKILVTLVNIAIVVYLVKLRRNRRQQEVDEGR